eukprot:NODE_1266_length_1496_cov_0.665712.p1 type:complete len:437 gc:universal NODE_1266_length_1496_cov_0.665712:10-1320(+)
MDLPTFSMKETSEDVKRQKVHWMKHPKFIEKTDNIVIEPYFRDILAKSSFDQFLPVQKAMLKYGLTKDVYLHTPTGSGKTFAYILLILHLLKDRKIPLLRIIIVVPSKDLVYQVFKCIESFGLNVVTAGNSEIWKEYLNLGNADVFITTPNRLVQQIENGLSLDHLYALIIDEADRLFNWEWVEQVVPRLPQNDFNHLRARLGLIPHKISKKHNFRIVLVSATLSSHSLLNLNPVYITNEGEGIYTVPKMYHFAIETESMLKPLHALSYLKENKNTQCLIFTKSVEASVRLSELLKIIIQSENINLDVTKIEHINGDLSDQKRKQLYWRFENKEINTLICSDLIARGIDLAVDAVIQYDVASNPKQFVHRCGRTSRGNNLGKSVILVEPEQLQILKYLKRIIPGVFWRDTLCKELKLEIPHIQALENAVTILRGRK